MKITSVIDGSTQMIIVPENDMEKEVLKKLNGGTAVLVSDNSSILGNNVSGALLIREGKDSK